LSPAQLHALIFEIYKTILTLVVEVIFVVVARRQLWADIFLQPAVAVLAMVNEQECQTVSSSVALPCAYSKIGADDMLNIVSSTVSIPLTVSANVPT
jgi:hypothetical protein